MKSQISKILFMLPHKAVPFSEKIDVRLTTYVQFQPEFPAIPAGRSDDACTREVESMVTKLLICKVRTCHPGSQIGTMLVQDLVM